MLVLTAEGLAKFLDGNPSRLVADVETYLTEPSDGKLLGVALAPITPQAEGIYIAIQWYDFANSQWVLNPESIGLREVLSKALENTQLIGHNYSYDKRWLDYYLGIDTKWHACTRLMWHMAAAPSGPRPYGLKDAQIELLKWPKKGSSELDEQVRARGGSLKSGDHYLADLGILARYACLDATSTAGVYNVLKGFFDKHSYWDMLAEQVEYSWLLQKCTEAGVRVDVAALEQQVEVLGHTKAAYAGEFLELAQPQIESLERMWREDRASKYTSPSARERFLKSWDLQKRFNLSSDKDKRELFYSTLEMPVLSTTEGGKPSTGLEALRASARVMARKDIDRLVEVYAEAEGAETLLNSFAKPWLASVRQGRLHPRFNPCGTVSYRLSGFKPYLLNAPFDEKELLSCFQCDEGWEGLHADFVSVEPAVTAHYSQDRGLLKVFGEGKGDVYLDLARTLFPNNVPLQQYYNPNVPVVSAIKKQFNTERTVAKTIQLAVQYTGTKYTVSKNLNMVGIPTSLSEADAMVQAYWRHFHKVAAMNKALFLRYSKQGYLRNVVGRIIRVPSPGYKDLPNRFIQSSAHDLLVLFVRTIFKKCQERGICIRPVLIDCHDSTSNQFPREQMDAAEQVYRDALTEVNNTVKMTVSVKIEMKRFKTLAGLKGEEV